MEKQSIDHFVFALFEWPSQLDIAHEMSFSTCLLPFLLEVLSRNACVGWIYFRHIISVIADRI